MEYRLSLWLYLLIFSIAYCILDLLLKILIKKKYDLFWRFENVVGFDMVHGGYWIREKVRYRRHKTSFLWERKTRRLFVVRRGAE